MECWILLKTPSRDEGATKGLIRILLTFPIGVYRTAREAEGAYLSYLQAEEKIDFNSYLTKLGLEESDHEAITTRVYDDDEEWERFENIFPHQLVVHELDELFDFRNWDYWNYSDLYLLLNALHERRFGDLWPRTMGLERKKQ